MTKVPIYPHYLLLEDSNWQVWFVRLSGWPVFLTVVIVGVLVAAAASVLLTKASNRSAVQTMLFATIAIALVALAVLAATAWLMGRG
jgi:hypothetical protein